MRVDEDRENPVEAERRYLELIENEHEREQALDQSERHDPRWDRIPPAPRDGRSDATVSDPAASNVLALPAHALPLAGRGQGGDASCPPDLVA